MIPFYGAEQPDLFAIERAAMDRPGLVIAELARLMPESGLVIDVGAGDGFTAEQLTTRSRAVVPVEPSDGMVRSLRLLPWVLGLAQELPIRTGAADGLYATWAYFFPKAHDVTRGLAEADRVVKPGGPIVIVDNLGGDEFTAMAERDITTDSEFWTAEGFEMTAVDTTFEFDSLEEARLLLGMFFGESGHDVTKTSLTFRVGVFSRPSRGPAAAVSRSQDSGQ